MRWPFTGAVHLAMLNTSLESGALEYFYRSKLKLANLVGRDIQYKANLVIVEALSF